MIQDDSTFDPNWIQLDLISPSLGVPIHLDTSASLGGANAASDVTEIPKAPVLTLSKKATSVSIRTQISMNPNKYRSSFKGCYRILGRFVGLWDHPSYMKPNML